jgi:Ca2+-binding RTX toxin-like protein
VSLKIISANITGSGFAVVTLAADENVRLEGGVTITGNGSNRGIMANGKNNSAEIQGTISNVAYGVDLGTEVASTTGHKVLVGSSGSITATQNAVVMSGGGGGLINYGTLTSTTGTAVRFSGGGLNPSTLENRGEISGGGGVVCYGQKSMTVRNFDLIEAAGLGYAYSSAGNTRDVVINKGTIKGFVALDFGQGNDLYDGRGGVKDGAVYGGAGDDRFILGALDTGNIFGDEGRDTLDYRTRAAGVTVRLSDGGTTTGNEGGASYIDIEQVFGSEAGADRIHGDNTANLIRGNGGNDRLFGGSGDDALIGGKGADRLSGDWGTDALTGAAGSDSFVIDDQDDGFDFITDFHNKPGDNDVFRIDASGFNVDLGIGALPKAWFRAGPTNQAQDANDRFLFRTTDATLWYDANGSAAGGRLKIADLQAGAVLTAGDIILF